MDEGWIHRTKSDDGTEIAGRVLGQGSPLVFVHGGAGDGETSWSALAPLLSERFACYLMSMRGRKPSNDHPDHSRERLVQDIVAFAESIGGPVGLVGHSSGGALALEAAARTPAISALALYEPTLFDLGPRDSGRDEAAFQRISGAVEEARLVDAVRIFLEDVALATDEELALLDKAGVFEVMARNLPVDLAEAAQSGPPQLSDLALLKRITIPVLLLHGSRTPAFYKAVVSAVADRLGHSQVREILGAAHLGPQLTPQPVANELARFFAGTYPPA
jgi:pimeloyl-ACP methyl ester carboxylesterase